jgi:UDP-glucose 4-epimerase
VSSTKTPHTSNSVIVTGGAGFIGSHLVDALIAEGSRVAVIDDLSSGSGELVNPVADLIRVDIRDHEALDAAVDRIKPGTIYHLAAQSSVTASVQDPRQDCEINVQGTLNLLEGARRHNAPVTFASTGGALYGKDAPIPTPERFIPSPLPPYGASKWAAETYVNTWANSSRLPHSILRISNVYGPRQSPHGEAGVVAIFSYSLWRGQQSEMYGHGKPTRDYIHVTDVAEAMMRANRWRGTVNVSTGIETSVLELYSTLSDAAGVSGEPELLPLREGELERSCMDPSLAEWMLGWRAQISLADGLPQTYRELVAEFEARDPAPTR